MVIAFVSMMGSITTFPLIHNHDGNRFFVNVHADVLDVNTHVGGSPWG